MTHMTHSNAVEQTYDDPARWSPRLQRLLEEQKTLLIELKKLSAQQTDLVKCADAERLLDVLGQRQDLIEKINARAEEFAPFKSRWAELMAMVAETERNGFQRLVDEIAELVRVVTDRDSEDRKELERQRARVSDQLETVSRGRGAVVAYGQQRPAETPRYQDRQG